LDLVQLQDHVQQAGGIVGTCRNALITMWKVMMHRNPEPESFPKLLDELKPPGEFIVLSSFN
jgi:hypothetical protein